MEYNASGTVLVYNTFGPNGLLARNTGSSEEFYAFDPQGNTTERINASGIDTSVETDAFGESQYSSPTTDPFRGFGAEWGYYADGETGLDPLGQRYYDPGLGRFLNRDPSGYDGGINLYNYTANDPVNKIDPSGKNGIGNILVNTGEGLELTGGITAVVGVVVSSTGAGALIGAPVATEGLLTVVTGIALAGVGNGLNYLDGDGGGGTYSLASGRQGKQQRLREIGNDDKQSSADRAWIQQDQNEIARGKRTSIRVPPGKNLAHRRDCRGRLGFGYADSNLQGIDLHKLQHKIGGYN